MTLLAEARLAMDLLASASGAVVAILLLKGTGWHSLVPALMMGLLVTRLDHVQSPQPALLTIAIAACAVLLVLRGPALRSVRLGAVVVCSLATAAMQVMARL